MQSEAEDLAGEEDDTTSEKNAAENEDRLHEPFYKTNISIEFFKSTCVHLKPLIFDQTTYVLLRDTEINPETVGRMKAGHKGGGMYQLRHVHMKAVIVYKYAEAYINLSNDPTHFLHGVIKASLHQAARALREYIGASAGEIGLSERTVANYLSEYRFFDAVAHEYPVVAVDEEALFGRSVCITPGGRGGFHMDRRGQHDHRPNFIFNETDLKIEAQQYMRKNASNTI